MRTGSFVFVLMMRCRGCGRTGLGEYQNIRTASRWPFRPAEGDDTTWTTEYGYKHRGILQCRPGRERYTLTVVDYNAIEAQGIERGRTARGAEPCIAGHQRTRLLEARHRGAMIFARSSTCSATSR